VTARIVTHQKAFAALAELSSMRRRRVLAGGAAAVSTVLAGCAHPAVVLDMDDASSSDIADEVSATVDAGSVEARVLADAIANGSATRRGRTDLFYGDDPVRFDGAFYDVTVTELDTETVTVYEVRLDFDPADATPDRGEIAYRDLPAVDRERLAPLVSRDHPTSDGYDVGFEYGTASDHPNESVLVPDQQYDIVVHDGDPIRVAVETDTGTESEYRYEATEVAASVDTYADRIQDRYLFTLAGLSESEREVVQNAIDGGHFTDNDAFQSVVDRIRHHDGITVDDFYGTWLLEYDGVDYLAYAEW
jgi:hypothetical protein